MYPFVPLTEVPSLGQQQSKSLLTSSSFTVSNEFGPNLETHQDVEEET